MRKVRLIFFSPTGTTREVLEAIAEGMEPDVLEKTNLTVKAFLDGRVDILPDEFVLIGSPVYVSRIPEKMSARFAEIAGNGAKCAVVAVYGNNKYGDALLELRDLAVECGFKPVAAAAFIGEHSFSSDERGIAAGRPDAGDKRVAKRFGRELRGSLDSGAAERGGPAVPGERPYVERKIIPASPPASDPETCLVCGSCGEVCPVGAISIGPDGVETDAGLCVFCCACVKECAAGARTLSDPTLNKIADRLHRDCAERKEPEIFL